MGFYYQNNAKAWMTAQLYQEWIQKWDRQLYEQKRKILLLQNNFSAHIVPPGLLSIWVLNFEPNLTGNCPRPTPRPRNHTVLQGALSFEVYSSSNKLLRWRDYTSLNLQYQSVGSNENGRRCLARCGRNNYPKLLAQGSDLTWNASCFLYDPLEPSIPNANLVHNADLQMDSSGKEDFP